MKNKIPVEKLRVIKSMIQNSAIEAEKVMKHTLNEQCEIQMDSTKNR